MSRIVYGVSGEGSGHSSRAQEMIGHLLSLGHEVKAVSYDRGYRNLKDKFDVFETEGLTIASADNQVSVVKTFTKNMERLGPKWRKLGELRRKLFNEFKPDCVVTDFEPMTAYLATYFDLPLVTLDNQHRMRYMEYPMPRGLRKEALMTESVIRAMVPRPDFALVTSYYFGNVKNERTEIFPPILRRAVLEARPSEGGHVLVYFTSVFESCLEVLKGFTRERFLVYGGDAQPESGPLRFRPFSADGFLADLASCKAVIATAGFTLMTESFHLGKPMLALPRKGQFEQELNGSLMAAVGYGKNCRKIDEESVGHFLYALPEYRARLAEYPRADNSRISARLAGLVADGAARARQYHAKRK